MRPGDRVRVVELLADPRSILAQTGVAGVHVGMLATIVSTRESEAPGWIEVRLDRAGELIAFRVEELEVIK